MTEEQITKLAEIMGWRYYRITHTWANTKGDTMVKMAGKTLTPAGAWEVRSHFKWDIMFDPVFDDWVVLHSIGDTLNDAELGRSKDDLRAVESAIEAMLEEE